MRLSLVGLCQWWKLIQVFQNFHNFTISRPNFTKLCINIHHGRQSWQCFEGHRGHRSRSVGQEPVKGLMCLPRPIFCDFCNFYWKCITILHGFLLPQVFIVSVKENSVLILYNFDLRFFNCCFFAVYSSQQTLNVTFSMTIMWIILGTWFKSCSCSLQLFSPETMFTCSNI